MPKPSPDAVAFQSANGKDIYVRADDGRHYWKDKRGKKHYCRHGKQKKFCKECGGASLCIHNRQKSQCNECSGSSICIHNKQKRTCKECGGTDLCKHGKQKRFCKECGGSGLCKHGKQKQFCKECGGSGLCKHGKQKQLCKDCGGSSICKHNRQKYLCKECGGSGICKHGKQKYQCKKCGGAGICIHNREKSRCLSCNPTSNALCKSGCGTTLTGRRRKSKDRLCARCTGHIENNQRQEIQWLTKLKSWGYEPSVHDKVIKDDDCNSINKRRVDYLFVTEKTFPYHVLVECDENNHSGYEISCEMARLQEVHDQLINNTGSVKQFVVVRFNPDASYDIDDELRSTLEDVFKGSVKVDDDRGFVVHALIGYGNKRRGQYDDNPLAKRITV